MKRIFKNLCLLTVMAVNFSAFGSGLIDLELPDKPTNLNEQIAIELTKDMNKYNLSKDDIHLNQTLRYFLDINKNDEKLLNAATLDTMQVSKFLPSMIEMIHPETFFGRISLAKKLISVTTDNEELNRRQKILKGLIEIRDNFSKFKKNVSSGEEAFLDLLDPPKKINLNTPYLVQLEDSARNSFRISEKYKVGEVRNRLRQFSATLGLVVCPVESLVILCSDLMLSTLHETPPIIKKILHSKKTKNCVLGVTGLFGLSCLVSKSLEPVRFLSNLPSTILNLLRSIDFQVKWDDLKKYPSNCREAYSEYRQFLHDFWTGKFFRDSNGEMDYIRANFSRIYCVGAVAFYNVNRILYFRAKALAVFKTQKKLIAIYKALRSIKEFCNLIKSNPDLSNVFVENGELDKLIDLSDKDMKELFKRLSSGSFDEEAIWITNQEKTVATYNLVKRIKDKLISIFAKAGEIEEFISVVDFIKERKKDPNGKVCFAEYLDSEKTFIQAEQFANPQLPLNKLVYNDLKLDGQSMIVTGHNMGGKTKAAQGMVFNLLLGQTVAIAIADKFLFTPYERFFIYKDVKESPEKSLYQAGIEKLLTIKKGVEEDTSKTAVFMDEVLVGTGVEEAEEVAFRTVKDFVELKHVMLLCTTHFKSLTKLEKDSSCNVVNYTVEDATFGEDDSLIYTYKLREGICHSNIAREIAERAGLLKTKS